METNTATSFTITKRNVAVLDFGVTSLKIVIIDPVLLGEPLHFQRIYLPLRTKKEEVESVLKTLLRSYADYHIRKFIVTTTSPLFASAQETVDFIVQSVTKFIHPANIAFYTHDEKFVSINEAIAHPEKVVSVGWKALGRGIWQLARKDGLIVDFSTRATSFIPIREGKILSESHSDLERIKNDELVFFGFLETNVAFIQPEFDYNGETYNLPFETHAITADLFLITDDLQPNDYVTETPDKKAKFREDALDRLKRTFCIIDDSFSENELVKVAHLLKIRMLEKINKIIKKKLHEHNLTRVIVTGIGTELIYKFLYDKNEYVEIIQTSDILKTAEVNPSYSLAYIYATKKDDD